MGEDDERRCRTPRARACAAGRRCPRPPRPCSAGPRTGRGCRADPGRPTGGGRCRSGCCRRSDGARDRRGRARLPGLGLRADPEGAQARDRAASRAVEEGGRPDGLSPVFRGSTIDGRALGPAGERLTSGIGSAFTLMASQLMLTAMAESTNSRIFAPGLLDGQVCVVSGAGTGLGKATALELTGLGATVIGCGRRTEPLQGMVDEVAARGGKAEFEALDIRDDEAVDALHGRRRRSPRPHRPAGQQRRRPVPEPGRGDHARRGSGP